MTDIKRGFICGIVTGIAVTCLVYPTIIGTDRRALRANLDACRHQRTEALLSLQQAKVDIDQAALQLEKSRQYCAGYPILEVRERAGYTMLYGNNFVSLVKEPQE